MDRLLAVEIRGYRAIDHVRMTFADDKPSILVGGNATGKSSVLDAIGLVGDLFRAGPSTFVAWRRGSFGVQHELPLSMLRRANAVGVRIELLFQCGDAVYTYNVQLADGPANDWFIHDEDLVMHDQHGERRLAQRDATGARLVRAGSPNLVPVFCRPHVPIVDYGIDEIGVPELSRPRKFLRGLCMLRPTPAVMWAGVTLGETPDPYGRDLSAQLASFLANNPSRYADYLSFLVGWTSFAMPRTGAWFCEGNEQINMALVSDGTRMELWLTALALAPPDAMSVALIDEPTTGFFSRSQQRPAELIKTLAVQRQVILTTHSSGLVSELDEGDGGHIWVCSRHAGAGMFVEPLLDIVNHDVVLDEGVGFAAMYSANELEP